MNKHQKAALPKTELGRLPNVGKVLEQNFARAGIQTFDQLKQMGAKEAFTRIRMIDPCACVMMLYGVEGAIQGVPYTCLSAAAKEELKKFFKTL